MATIAAALSAAAAPVLAAAAQGLAGKDVALALTCGALASSSLLYTFIWRTPASFATLVAPRDPCTAMLWLSAAIKAAQFAGIAHLMDYDAPAAAGRVAALAASSPQVVGVALLVLLLGQHLNASVYAALGTEGVYYGARFGRVIPWCKGWPYSFCGWPIRDPQYLGCIASLLGAAVFVEAPRARAALAFWLLNYLYLIVLEGQAPSDESESANVGAGAGAGIFKRLRSATKGKRA